MSARANSILLQAIDEQLSRYRSAADAGSTDNAWNALERAHILSQSRLGLHLTVHWTMLGYAIRLRDVREGVGQLARLALAPLGGLTGRTPVGNTGRSNVSAFQPMPIPPDLLEIVENVESK